MKSLKLFLATLILSGSIVAVSASLSVASRVRTVPSPTDQKKTECDDKKAPAKKITASITTMQHQLTNLRSASQRIEK